MRRRQAWAAQRTEADAGREEWPPAEAFDTPPAETVSRETVEPKRKGGWPKGRPRRAAA